MPPQAKQRKPVGSAIAAPIISQAALHISPAIRPQAMRLSPFVNRSRELMHETLRAAFDALAAGKSAWPLFVCGSTGVGKTAGCLAESDWIDSRYPIWGGTVADVVREFSDAQLSVEKITRLAEKFVAQDLVIVDEVGLRAPTDFALDAICTLADWRGRRPTIWISNHDDRALNGVYDERVMSRMTCGTCCRLVGDDRRFSR